MFTFPLPRNGAATTAEQSADVKAALDEDMPWATREQIMKDYPCEFDEWVDEWERGDRDRFVAGDRVVFANTGHDDHELLDHDGQTAEVVRALTVMRGHHQVGAPAGWLVEQPGERDAEVGPMYVVRFADGKELDAFEDELTKEA